LTASLPPRDAKAPWPVKSARAAGGGACVALLIDPQARARVEAAVSAAGGDFCRTALIAKELASE